MGSNTLTSILFCNLPLFIYLFLLFQSWLSQDLRNPVTAPPLIAESDTMHGYYTITTWQLSFFTIERVEPVLSCSGVSAHGTEWKTGYTEKATAAAWGAYLCSCVGMAEDGRKFSSWNHAVMAKTTTHKLEQQWEYSSTPKQMSQNNTSFGF